MNGHATRVPATRGTWHKTSDDLGLKPVQHPADGQRGPVLSIASIVNLPIVTAMAYEWNLGRII